MDTGALPKTRAEAKAAGAAYYFTGEPCKHGHIAPRKTKGACVECMRAEWKAAAPKRAAYFAAYSASPERKKAAHEYYQKNKEVVIARAKAIPAERKSQYKKAWFERNADAKRLFLNVRRRRFREATPSWLTKEQRQQIKDVYAAAAQMAKTTGERYVVDHIFPLQSDIVCGLHVPWNLRVITRTQNAVKSNKMPGDEAALAFTYY